MATVVIVTPVYATPENGRLELLHQTLGSVQRQTYPTYIHLVVDDGSPSDVKSVVCDKRDPRLRYVKRERHPQDLKTASNALNFGICLAISGNPDIFTREEAKDLTSLTYLHSDDLLTQDSLGTRLNALSNGIVYSDMAIFNTQCEITSLQRMKGYLSKEQLLHSGLSMRFNHHTTLWELNFLRYLDNFTKKMYGQKGVFDPNICFGEDRDTTYSSLEAAIDGNFDVRHIPRVTVLYRIHEKSITGEDIKSHNGISKPDLRRVLIKHFGDNPSMYQIIVNETVPRMTGNMPWSLFYFLPRELKEMLRPFKNFADRRNMTSADKELLPLLQQTLAHQ
jgi:glycosyltransferase involved in cell wall biosynthesis